jgi:DNA-binding MarR family transcriptional regulator
VKRGIVEGDRQAAATLDYASYVTGMISWLSNRLSSGASAVYRGMFGIGVMEWRVMAHLAIEPGATGARIGRVIGLDKAAVSRTVTVLIGRGLVTRVEGAERGQRLRLTAPGLALHGRVLKVAMEREGRLLSGLSEDEQAVLRGLLNRLLQVVPAAPE